MVKKIKPDANLGEGGNKNWEDLQDNVKKNEFNNQLLKVRDKVPTRPPANFKDSFELVDMGQEFNNLYAFFGGQWKKIAGGFLDADLNIRTVSNTTSKALLFSTNVIARALATDSAVRLQIPIFELGLKTGISQDQFDIIVEFGNDTVFSVTHANNTGSDIVNDNGMLQIDILNKSFTTQTAVYSLQADNFDRTETALASVDTESEDNSLDVYIQFEAADSANEIKIDNPTARILT